MDTGLSGRHVLVTGASGGIGIEVTRMLLHEGARVTGTYNRSIEPLHDLITRWQDDFQALRVDQTSETSVKTLFEDANRKFGRVDVLIANAGIANHEGTAIQ